MEEDNLWMALTATEVGMEQVSKLMDYSSRMMVEAIQRLATIQGCSVKEMLHELETSLGLTGVMEEAIRSLSATKQVIGDYIQGPKP
jgi:hypothetical protein